MLSCLLAYFARKIKSRASIEALGSIEALCLLAYFVRKIYPRALIEALDSIEALWLLALLFIKFSQLTILLVNYSDGIVVTCWILILMVLGSSPTVDNIQGKNKRVKSANIELAISPVKNSLNRSAKVRTAFPNEKTVPIKAHFLCYVLAMSRSKCIFLSYVLA